MPLATTRSETRFLDGAISTSKEAWEPAVRTIMTMKIHRPILIIMAAALLLVNKNLGRPAVGGR